MVVSVVLAASSLSTASSGFSGSSGSCSPSGYACPHFDHPEHGNFCGLSLNPRIQASLQRKPWKTRDCLYSVLVHIFCKDLSVVCTWAQLSKGLAQHQAESRELRQKLQFWAEVLITGPAFWFSLSKQCRSAAWEEWLSLARFFLLD